MGYTRAQALAIIAGVCTGIMGNVPPGGDYDLAWLAEIREEALCRLQREMSGK